MANIKKFFAVTELIDKKNNIDSTSIIKRDFAKYSSYPTMLKYAKMDRRELKKCKQELEGMGVADSKYFKIYYYSLLVFGPKFCEWGVNAIKKIHGGRPEL